jgi:hypothetical protein
MKHLLEADNTILNTFVYLIGRNLIIMKFKMKDL